MERTITARGRATRQRIIAETGRQILAAGIGGTSLDSVRAATLTSKSQLFHYFPGGKTELVREVAVWEAAQLQAAQQPDLDDLGSWASWERWRSALVEYYIGLGRWACPIGSLAFEAAATDAVLAATIADAFATWRSALAAGIRRMQHAGEIDAAARPERLAAAIQAAIQGGLVLCQAEHASWPLEAALDTLLIGLRSAATGHAPPS